MKIYCIVIIIFQASLTLSCKSNTDSNKIIQKNAKMKYLKNKTYMLNYDISYPAEILLNDLIIEIDLEENPFSPSLLNDYILKNGKQHLRIKIFHPNNINGSAIKPEIIAKLNEDLEIFVFYKVDEEIDSMKSIKKLNFPKLDLPVPYIEHTWEFEAELPFDLIGWENSEDLSKLDRDILEEKVLQKFNQLRDLLNSGNGAGFVKELAFANKEYFIANYFTPDQHKEYTNNLIEAYSEHKGIMPPIENYRMRILGNGKVVALENLGKYKGQGVLTAEAKNSDTLFQNYIMLHIPNGSKDFEIVRINSQMASVEEE